MMVAAMNQLAILCFMFWKVDIYPNDMLNLLLFDKHFLSQNDSNAFSKACCTSDAIRWGKLTWYQQSLFTSCAII